jgi:hypothetical protein
MEKGLKHDHFVLDQSDPRQVMKPLGIGSRQGSRSRLGVSGTKC